MRAGNGAPGATMVAFSSPGATGRNRTEPCSDTWLAGGRGVEDGVGQFAEDVHGGDLGGGGRIDPAPPAEIERLLVEVEDQPRRSLEVSRMGVIVRAGIQRGQEQGHGPL